MILLLNNVILSPDLSGRRISSNIITGFFVVPIKIGTPQNDRYRFKILKILVIKTSSL